MGYSGEGIKIGQWFVLCGEKEPVALAFDRMLGYASVPRTDLFEKNSAKAQKDHGAGVFHYMSKIGFIVDIESILKKLETSV